MKDLQTGMFFSGVPGAMPSALPGLARVLGLHESLKVPML
jgi:hypothetical protein